MPANKSLDFLTSLRGVAAIWVVFYHIKMHLANYLPDSVIFLIAKGYLAVDFFFVLSGFIIAMSYQDKINLLEWRTVGVFLKKRFARIYPLHFFCLMLYLVIPISYWLFDKALSNSHSYAVDNFILSLFLINNWGFNDALSWNVPSWSISTEFGAYLAFPLLTLLFKKGHVVIYCLFIVVAVFVLHQIYAQYGLVSIGKGIPKVALMRCIIEFFIGMCVWNIYKSKINIPKLLNKFILILSILSIFLVFYGYLPETIFAPLLIALCVYSLLIYSEGEGIKGLSYAWLVYLGEISYSIYLSHYFIRDLFKIVFLEGQTGSIVWILSYFFVVIAFSSMTYRYVEVPMRYRLNQ